MNPNPALGRQPLEFKILFTGFLMVMGAGLLMAGLQIMLTHGMADGRAGLSVTDIVYSYYGNRSGSRLEFMLNGQMKPMAPDAARFKLIEWARDGAPAAGWAPTIKPIVQQYCVSCHNSESTLPDFTKLANLQTVAEVDQGVSINTLTRVSHIHLFGIAFIFMFIGWIFALAEFPKGWKALLIAIPFIFLLADIFSWWMTKFAPDFAWLTLIGGICYSVASTIMIFTSLAQMWLPRWTKRV